MNTDTIIMLLIQAPIIGMLFLFSYLIIKKEYYGLISGFSMKPEEEQEELIKNGYPQATGKILRNAGIILLIGTITYFIGSDTAILVSYLVMTVFFICASTSD